MNREEEGGKKALADAEPAQQRARALEYIMSDPRRSSFHYSQ